MNHKTLPLVSLAIPVFNGSDFMSLAIDSALAQTYPHVEIIVVNDGSSDEGETEKIALSYGDRVSYYSKKNGGVGSALNLALNKSCGEYIGFPKYFRPILLGSSSTKKITFEQ